MTAVLDNEKEKKPGDSWGQIKKIGCVTGFGTVGRGLLKTGCSHTW